MAKNDTNIFDLVDELNKSKNKTSMEKEKEINNIYSMLDDIKNDNNISVEEVRNKVNDYSYQTNLDNDSLENYSTVVSVPTLPSSVSNYDTFSECIIAFFKAVDYGTNNSKQYVKGHKAALEKYCTEIAHNHKDIYVVEGKLNDEINNFASKDDIYSKGYYDGLFYVLRAIKKAKALLSSKINIKLREQIG